MIGVRDYQNDCHDSVLSALETDDCVLAVMPTGTGKTFTGMRIIETWFSRNPNRVALWLAHREELIFQPAKSWQKLTGLHPLIEMGELHANSLQRGIFGSDVDNRFIIATVQTLNAGRRCTECSANCLCNDGTIDSECRHCEGNGCDACDGRGSRETECPDCKGSGIVRVNVDCENCYQGVVRRFLKFDAERVGLVVMDEAHHSTATTYRRVKEYFSKAKLLGLTATPDRADEVAMANVYTSCAFDYQLNQAIDDGWLTPILQQYVVVEDLDFSSVRTTAGDLNEGDLERIIGEESMMHKIATPTIELAGDRPTLAFTPGVDSARTLTDIFNRHKPDSAVCITGRTPREERRYEIERFQKGERQYLVGCGVFLEGFDAPATSVICMARPTKSRSLYSQAVGRGTRPLPGVVDGLGSAEERRSAIAFSDKPECLVLDFVGNSGRHKLISTADILGDRVDPGVVAQAVEKARENGGSADMRDIIAKIMEENEQRRLEAEARRAGLKANAKYSTAQINPFDIFDRAPSREPGWFRGKVPTEKMMETLRKFKVDLPPELTYFHAKQLIDTAISRARNGLASYGQVKLLRKFGIDGLKMTFKDASAQIDRIAKNNWRVPA